MVKKTALYYEKGIDKKVRCCLCPHHCVIPEGEKGICGVRKNTDGILIAESYSKITAMALDPIEKKPLNNYKPKSNILSIGMYGCNFSCAFCQNYIISKGNPKVYELSPKEAAQKALELKNEGNIGIAYTYNEPLVAFEYVYDTAKIVKENSMDNILVTNGYICDEPLMEILKYIDAMNIDLKAFNNEFYKKICNGSLDPVLKTIETASKFCHVEVTCLIISGLNDSIKDISGMAKTLSEYSNNISLHLTRFFPNYKMMDVELTPINTLVTLKNEAAKYLNKVYLGNVPNFI